MRLANDDPEITPWLFGVLKGQPTAAGSFLYTLALAASGADFSNYEILRPALLQLKEKYPNYKEEPQDVQEPKQHKNNR